MFKSTEGGGITDADIDVLLAQGEERTKAASDKLKKDMAKLVGTTVTLEDLLKTGDTSYLYEDPDAAGGPGSWAAGGSGLMVPLPEREKKTSGCVPPPPRPPAPLPAP